MPLMFGALLALLALALYAPAALSQVRGPSGADGSFNCADFDTQEQAQAFFDAQGGLAGGDPDGLDADNDGIPCETLPSGEAEDGTMMGAEDGEEVAPTTPTLGDSSAVAFDPAEFERSEINPNGPCFDPQIAPDVVGVPVEDLAFAFVNRNDPVGTPLVSPLDSNNSGIACDALTQEEAALISGTSEEQPAPVEQPDVPAAEQPDVPAVEEAPDTALPETGGPALLLPLAGLMVAAGLGLAFIRRR